MILSSPALSEQLTAKTESVFASTASQHVRRPRPPSYDCRQPPFTERRLLNWLKSPVTGRQDRLRGVRSRTARSQGGGLCERVEQRLCRPQIGRFEALRKLIIHRRQERTRLSAPSLVAPQPSETGGTTQFPGQGSLAARPVEALLVMILCRIRGL
jgi:hypothetical protein